MAKGNTTDKIGSWAFIGGVVIAVIAGLLINLGILSETVITSVLVILGLIVGFLNVTDSEVKDYLIAAVSLVIVTSFGGQIVGSVATVGPYLQSIMGSITTFVVPATIIVALKEIYSLAQN